MAAEIPQGELSRAIVHEPDDGWPSSIEIVAYWEPEPGRERGRKRSIKISANEFFGRGGYGAPISGDRLIGMIDRLRRMGPTK